MKIKTLFLAACTAICMMPDLATAATAGSWADPSPYPTYRANSYEYLGYPVTTNLQFAVMPANSDARTVNFFSDNAAANLRLFVPRYYLTITQAMAYSVGSNVPCDVSAGDWDNAWGAIVYQRSNGCYQLARVHSTVNGGCILSNATVGYTTLLNNVYSNDLIYLCAIYTVASAPKDASGVPIPAIWNGAPLYGGQGANPIGFEWMMAKGNSVTNFFLTVSGNRYPGGLP